MNNYEKEVQGVLTEGTEGANGSPRAVKVNSELHQDDS